MKQPQETWFTSFYGIDLPQYELPFVDFRLDADVPLYLDPAAISKDPSELAAHCHNAVVSYFQTLLEAIGAEDRRALRRLISRRLSEPEQIHLGVSKRARRGRGIGPEQESQILDALRGSSAAKAGAIQAIQELELHIRQIGPDKVSDLVANIILCYLTRFTEETCEAFGIPTRPCPVDGFWDTNAKEWSGGFFNLPTRDLHSYVLVPKRFVRRERDLMSHSEFYRKYILEILQRELLTAGDALVRTLQTGERKVYKKDIQDDPRFGLSKEFISEFIVTHPESIRTYREDLDGRFRPVDPAVWSGKADEDDPAVQEALALLPTLLPGREAAHAYHETVLTLVRFVFDEFLENFEKELKMDGGRGRIDIIADNFAGGGFFMEARREHNASSVPMECKNYADDLGNGEYNQIADRLGSTTSGLGMVFCRTVNDRRATIGHVGDRWLRHQVIILVIDDDCLQALVSLRLARNFEGIEALLRKWERDVKFKALS